MNFYGTSMEYLQRRDEVWPAGRTGPPKDAPFCGFDNENPACWPDGRFYTSTSYSVADDRSKIAKNVKIVEFHDHI